MADELSIMDSFNFGYMFLSILITFVGLVYSTIIVIIPGLVLIGLPLIVLIYKSVMMRFRYPKKTHTSDITI